MINNVTVSNLDKEHLRIIRNNVSVFLSACAKKYDAPGVLLDIAPQDHAGAAAHFTQAEVCTLDIDPKANATYTADLCHENKEVIQDDYFDMVVCTEVLEHTLNPFSAVKEIYRILKPGGLVFISTPFNFRIHGPLPDCWRFSEHGLRALLEEFEILSLEEIASKGRDLMPIQYTVVVRKSEGNK